MIESRQLRYFVAVAEHLHFGKAADMLNIAQSALSTQIKHLELDLDVVLINRRKRAALSLTEAGELFLTEARLALRQLERTEQVGRLAARGLLGHINLGYIMSAAVSGVLAQALGEFRKMHPDVIVNLVPLDTPSQIRALAGGAIDIGLIRPRPEYAPDLEVCMVQSDELVLAMSITNPLAEFEAISPEMLRAERFIVPQFNEAAGFAEILRRLTEPTGGIIEPAIQVPDFISALSLAAAGYGIVLVPRSFDKLSLANIVHRQIANFDDTATLVMAWRSRSLSTASRALVQVLRNLG